MSKRIFPTIAVEAGHRSAMDDYKVLTDTIMTSFGGGVPAPEEGSSPMPVNDAGSSEVEAPDEDILEFGPAGDINGEEEK